MTNEKGLTEEVTECYVNYIIDTGSSSNPTNISCCFVTCFKGLVVVKGSFQENLYLNNKKWWKIRQLIGVIHLYTHFLLLCCEKGHFHCL